jgi:hypothetical protein
MVYLLQVLYIVYVMHLYSVERELKGENEGRESYKTVSTWLIVLLNMHINHLVYVILNGHKL